MASHARTEPGRIAGGFFPLPEISRANPPVPVPNPPAMSAEKTAITPTRAQDFPNGTSRSSRPPTWRRIPRPRGCMVIKPWGYGVWELIQQPARRPHSRPPATRTPTSRCFIPLSYLEKEAEHAEGFATECAVVTHHRLEAMKDPVTGKTKMIPHGELAEPLRHPADFRDDHRCRLPRAGSRAIATCRC